MAVSGQLHCTAALPQGETHGTHRVGGRASSDLVEKRNIRSLCWDQNPRIVQSVA